MAQQKHYKTALQPGTRKLEPAVENLKIDLPRNPRNHRQIDHSQYLGLGFDAWAIQSIHVIRALLQGGNFAVATLIGYSVTGLRNFMNFLSGNLIESPPATPSALTKRHMERYIP